MCENGDSLIAPGMTSLAHAANMFVPPSLLDVSLVLEPTNFCTTMPSAQEQLKPNGNPVKIRSPERVFAKARGVSRLRSIGSRAQAPNQWNSIMAIVRTRGHARRAANRTPAETPTEII